MNLFPHATSYSCTARVHFKVKCIEKNKNNKLTIGKRYIVNEISRLSGDVRVTCDSGRNVWYSKKFFKEVKK